MDTLTSIAEEARKNYKPKNKDFICEFCKRGFAKEKTLINHMCEPKRRWNQQYDKGVQYGFKTYLRFYEINLGGQKKSYSDFMKSNYYSAFVKFGKHILDIKAINPNAFIDYILNPDNQIKLDKFCNDSYYQSYLEKQLKSEHWKDAISRSIKTMEKWSSEHNIGQFNVYFFSANPNQICNHIVNGRISGWAIFNCDTGLNFLSNVSAEHRQMIYPYIDPNFWQPKFKMYDEETMIVKEALKEIGL